MGTKIKNLQVAALRGSVEHFSSKLIMFVDEEENGVRMRELEVRRKKNLIEFCVGREARRRTSALTLPKDFTDFRRLQEMPSWPCDART